MFDFFRRHAIPVLLNFILPTLFMPRATPVHAPPLNAAHFRIRIVRRASAGENNASPCHRGRSNRCRKHRAYGQIRGHGGADDRLGPGWARSRKRVLYDLILLDLNLPDMSGFDVLRSLRFGKIKTPVLILSGLNGTEHKVKGLGLGADDYLTKPFQSDELIARIRAILRRSGDQVESVIRCGDLTLKLDQKRAEMGRCDLGLTTKEYQMLELLGMRQGTPITKDMFLGHLYGGMDEPDQKIIDVFICKLRKKLMQASGGRDYIDTIWGRGYALRDPEPIKATSLLRATG